MLQKPIQKMQRKDFPFHPRQYVEIKVGKSDDKDLVIKDRLRSLGYL
jgi:hypothetical protein